MLVLTRKPNQEIIINNNIKILVVAVNGDKVKIGIQAPKDVLIHRKEVYEILNKEIDHEKVS